MLPFSADHLRYTATKPLPFAPVAGRLAQWLAHKGAAGFVSSGSANGRYSYLTAEPVAEAALAYDDPREVAGMLREMAGDLTPGHEKGLSSLPPFSGGMIGLATFELGLRLEGLRRRPFRIEGRQAWPELVVRLYTSVLAWDHQDGTLTAIGRGATLTKAETACDRIIALYDATPESPAPDGPLCDAPLRSETPDAVHEDKVAALVQQIHAGDLFQANLARGWTGWLRDGITPGDVMAALQARGASPFGGFFTMDGRAVISNSPERFVQLDAGGHLETKPIKGTRPRGATPPEDTALAAELLASPKDRAENLMIVDLMRHDLSRVSEVGSVKVTALNALESFANVHHLVSTVTGQLAAGLAATDVLAATFPPGSISGAPKVQAMKVIHEMEAARGPYCGSLFFIDSSGAMDSSVLIRTIVMEKQEGRWALRACAGGGIVADSDPVAERIETETKLSLIRSVLEGQGV